MRSFTIPMLLAALQVCAQAQSVLTPSQREAAVRLKLAPETILRGDARAEYWAALDVENLLTVYSQRSGEVLWKTRIGEASPPRDFALDREGVLYWLGAEGKSISKWRPLAAGAEFSLPLSLDGDPASAIAVDPEGLRMFVAAAGRIWILDGTDASVVLRGGAELEATVTQLRFDHEGNVLVAAGDGFTATLPLTLDRADVFRSTSEAAAFAKLPAASNSNNRAAIYPVIFRMDPQVQTVNPGGTVLITVSTLRQDAYSGPNTVTVDSPLPATLNRNTMTAADAVGITIPVPANQAPGVYRVVAKLDNGASGYASAVFVVPLPGSSVIPFYGTGFTRNGPVPGGLADPSVQIINPIDSQCSTAVVAYADGYPVSTAWGKDFGASQWLSGRQEAAGGCLPGLYRFRTNIDLREFDPATANIAVSVFADNAATLEINGVAIPAEPQPDSEPLFFLTPRAYAIPRQLLHQGFNALDIIVRNDPWPGTTRNPMGLRMNVLVATAKPITAPEPPPIGDFWLSLSPPFKFVNGTTTYYTINVHRTGGFAGTPVFSLNDVPPTGYAARFIGNVLEVTRNLNVPNAPTTYRFAVLGIFSNTTRSVDGAFIQNNLVPVDLPLFGTGVTSPGVTAGAGSIDTHYAMLASADPAFPGPNARVVNEATSPIGRWYPNDQFSRWIGPRTDANNSNTAGLYRYRTTFDLGLGSPDAAAIALKWAADNDAKVYLNSILVASAPNPENFFRLNEALITYGFKQGVNILEFEVNNLDLGGPSPQGLRVQVVGAQAARNPTRAVQVLRGQSAVGPVPLAPGTFTHDAPPGITITTNTGNLIFAASDVAPLGITPVRIVFTANSAVMNVLVVVGHREAVSYAIASTGQADEGTLDPNYRMVESIDRLFLPPNAYVILSNRGPIAEGIWAPNNINSRWIAPRTDAWLPNAPGVYRYRTTFNLTGRNINTAVLALEWAADNRGRIELNGVIKDEINVPDGFRALRPVSILTGFQEGVNTIDFVVINDGPDVTPTGLHVNILGAFAVSQGSVPGPDFSITANPGVRQIVPGEAATFDVRITPNFTFNEFVNISIPNPPAGMTFLVNANSKFEFVVSVLTSSSVAKAQYPITIRGRWGDIVRDTQVRLDLGGTDTGLVTVASTGQGGVGAVDPNYKYIDEIGVENNMWVANFDESTVIWPEGPWIAPTPQKDNFASPGTYRFRTTFNVPPNVNPQSIIIRGRWNADDDATVYLNGQAIAVLYRGLPFEHAGLRIDRGFQAGPNQLDFVVTNNNRSPVGLMVIIDSVTATQQ